MRARPEPGRAAPPDPTSPADWRAATLHIAPSSWSIAAVALALAFSATTALDAWYRTAKAARGSEHFRTAERLSSSDLPAAVRHYRAALTFDPTSEQYRLALARALFRSGRLDEAASYVSEVLERDPVDGVANRLAARVLARRHRGLEAAAQYSRAIYGLWHVSPDAERRATRLEMIEQLRDLVEPTRLIPELLHLEADVRGEPLEEIRVARLLASFGEHDDALRVFRRAAVEQPHSAAAWQGLADAAFASGAYRDARAAAERALAIDPHAEGMRGRLEVADRVLALDPMLPRLSARMRDRRERAVLQAVVSEVARCRPDETAVPADIRARLVLARTLAAPRRRRADADEKPLALAIDLWRSRPRVCAGAPVDEALARLLDRLGSSPEREP